MNIPEWATEAEAVQITTLVQHLLASVFECATKQLKLLKMYIFRKHFQADFKSKVFSSECKSGLLNKKKK